MHSFLWRPLLHTEKGGDHSFPLPSTLPSPFSPSSLSTHRQCLFSFSLCSGSRRENFSNEWEYLQSPSLSLSLSVLSFTSSASACFSFNFWSASRAKFFACSALLTAPSRHDWPPHFPHEPEREEDRGEGGGGGEISPGPPQRGSHGADLAPHTSPFRSGR